MKWPRRIINSLFERSLCLSFWTFNWATSCLWLVATPRHRPLIITNRGSSGEPIAVNKVFTSSWFHRVWEVYLISVITKLIGIKWSYKKGRMSLTNVFICATISFTFVTISAANFNCLKGPKKKKDKKDSKFSGEQQIAPIEDGSLKFSYYGS